MRTTDDLRRTFAKHEHLAPDLAEAMGPLRVAVEQRRRQQRSRLTVSAAAAVIAAVAIPTIVLGGDSDVSRPDQPAASRPPSTASRPVPGTALVQAPPLDLPTFPLQADPAPAGTSPEVLWLGGDQLVLLYRHEDAVLSYSVEIGSGIPTVRPVSTGTCQGRSIGVFESSSGGGPAVFMAFWTLADGRTAELRAPASASEADLLAFCESLGTDPLSATVSYDVELVPAGWTMVSTSAVQLALGSPDDPSGPQIVVGLRARTPGELGGRTVSIGDRFGTIITVSGVGPEVVLPLDADRELRVTFPDNLELSDGELLQFVAGITVLPGALVGGT